MPNTASRTGLARAQRSAPVPVGSVVSEDAIERTLAAIRHLARDASLRFALDLGEIVTARIFGSVEQARLRGERDTSFRRLAAHPDLPMSASTLWRAVQVFALSQRLPEVTRAPQLSVTHLYLVTGLPDESQEVLLKAAIQRRMTPGELRLAILRHREPRGRGGRPRLPAALKAARALRSAVEGTRSLGGGAELSAGQRAETEAILRELRSACDRLEAALEAPAVPSVSR